MTWTSDTLAYEGSDQTLMTSLYATSPNNAWICGHNDRSKGNVWHFDGNKWQFIDMYKYIRVSANSYYKVSGSSANNVWFVGNRHYSDPFNPSTIWWEDLVVQYDGSTFKEHDLNSTFAIFGLHAISPNEVWVGGDSGFVAKYNGITWSKDTIDIPKGGFQLILDLAKYDGEVFAIISVFDPKFEKYYFAKGNLNNWKIVDSIYYDGKNFEIKWGYWGLYVSEYGKLYSYGVGGIWEWQKGWVKILRVNYTIKGMYGLKEDYILAVGDFGHVLYYDGTSWQQIQNKLSIPDQSYDIITGAWTNGREAIILGHTFEGWPQKTIVFRGK
jgi:hypothetical protein